MFFERIEDQGLAQYSYLLACERAGEAVVVDPRRDIDVYVDLAERRGLRITYVLETHIHADFASGARELAEATGAELALSAYDRGETYQSQLPHLALLDGDSLEIGRVRLQALHTPGHTPEHLSFLVFDGARSQTEPMLLLSGDFLFVGSLGRPDLLGEEATRALASQLYASVRRALRMLPDWLEIAPGHGAGSMCGAGMSSRASSTFGFERIANPYLRADLTEAQFIGQILARVPPFPPYYLRMKALNARGPRILKGLPGLTRVAVDRARSVAAHDAASASRFDAPVVIDLRGAQAFAEGHLAGAFAIGAGTNVSTWASWVVPYETPLLLVASSDEEAEAAVRSLVRVGLDDVRGVIDGGVDDWRAAGCAIETIGQITPAALAARLAAPGGAVTHVLDVRAGDEWKSGHIAHARNIMAGELPARLDEVPADGALAIVCGTGYRSMVAASVLQRAGRAHLLNVTGGMNAWRDAGLPIAVAPAPPPDLPDLSHAPQQAPVA